MIISFYINESKKPTHKCRNCMIDFFFFFLKARILSLASHSTVLLHFKPCLCANTCPALRGAATRAPQLRGQTWPVGGQAAGLGGCTGNYWGGFAFIREADAKMRSTDFVPAVLTSASSVLGGKGPLEVFCITPVLHPSCFAAALETRRCCDGRRSSKTKQFLL